MVGLRDSAEEGCWAKPVVKPSFSFGTVCSETSSRLSVQLLVLHWFEGSWPRFSTLLDMFALQFELDSSSQRNAGSFLKSGGAGVVLGAGVWVHLSTKG